MSLLSPEDQKRIEEEERYRAEVRARMEQERASVQGRQPPPQNSRKGAGGSVWEVGAYVSGIVLGCGLVVFLVLSFVFGSHQSIAAPSVPGPGIAPRTPIRQNIADGQIIVNPGQCVWYKIEIPSNSIDGRVAGSFNASGGFGNDIQAAILIGDTNLTNYINGHQAQGFWFTPGPQTAGNFDVALRPGTYYLVFNNRTAVLSQKQVFVNPNLTYNRY